MQTNACTIPMNPPAIMASIIARTGLAVRLATAKPASAPTSIMPSTPKFKIPERSA